MSDGNNNAATRQTPGRVRVYLQSLAISFLVVLVVAAIASAPRCSALWSLLLPGAFLAAVFFPQGVNSSGGNAYLVVAGLLDVALLAFAVMWLLSRYERWKSSRG